MQSLFTTENLVSLLTLSVLEIVLGIDNVIFVSILIGRLDETKKLRARRIWMIAGITIRTLLLMSIGWLVQNGSSIGITVFDYHFDLRNLIMLAGGLFLLWKTVKEIHEKLEGEDVNYAEKGRPKTSFASLITQIIFIDTIFSFDSIITAIGLARKVPVMIIAVIIAMIIMFFFSNRISIFIHKHPTLKMLALSFLLMVGFSLFFEGLEPIHHTHIDKGYIYFAMAFSFGVEMLNLWMRKKRPKPVSLKEPVASDLEEPESDLAK
jgi:predicted tellurium resistance membrane protein TerC